MKRLLLFFVPLLSLSIQAQQRCGTVEYEELRNKKFQKESKDQFEQWMKEKLRVTNRMQPFRNERTQGTTFIVPVVVHVINNGEAIGTGTNISDAQIQSQMVVLNKDYQRLNSDASNTPSEFVGVAGNMNVQFVLAQQDPNGLATNGIVRVVGTQTSWSINDDLALKSLSYWPAENYLNIWITNLTGGFLGYTQLPVSSTLAGLDQSSNDRLTDGVVIHYQAFGTADAGSFNLLSRYNKGRTATHEVGHYFGLRHIWGDATGCATDYVDDTPTQNNSTDGCPTGVLVSCGNDNMYQNYLDYTDDACMNIFTQGQVARMNVVAQNSPRRASLVNSLGATPPSPVANDLGIKSISNPLATACSGNVSPAILVRNYGTTDISTSNIQFSLNGSTQYTQNVSFNPALSPNTEATVNFNPVSVSEGNNYNFSFLIVDVNGGADGKPSNNQLNVNTYIPVSAALPLFETFNTTPATWTIENPSGVNPWQNISVSATNNAMYMNFYNDQNVDTYSRLVSPVLDLTTATTATLSFDHAYAPYQGVTIERLRVLVYTSCAYNSSAVEVFNKAGTNLGTAPETASSFVPASSDWQTNFISLNSFLGQRIQIAFEGTNGYGNNLYIDNVSVLNSSVTALQLSDLVSPSPLSCQSSPSSIVAVKNIGNTTITSFEAHVYVNGAAGTTQLMSGFSLAPNASQNFTLNPVNFNLGNNTISIALKKPNGISNNVQGDSLSFLRSVNTSADQIPLRQNFNKATIGNWAEISPQSGQNWFLAQTNDSISLIFNSFSNTKIGEQAWLVSPVLDFTHAPKASFFFDTSYGKRAAGSDKLELYVSEDCGETFPSILYSASGSDLANAQSETSWLPSASNDWTTNFVNLDSYAGKKNLRFALVATNGHGNNLYLDNLEFFEDDNSKHLAVPAPYSIYGGLSTDVKITFNLSQRQDAHVQVYSMQGSLQSDQSFTDILNQTYTIDVPYAAAGLYIVRVQIGNRISATKVWIGF